MQKTSAMVERNFERVPGAHRADAQRLNAQAQVLRRACRGSKIEDVVHWSRVEGLADILLFKTKARFAPQVGQIIEIAGGEIVDSENRMTGGQQAIGEV